MAEVIRCSLYCANNNNFGIGVMEMDDDELQEKIALSPVVFFPEEITPDAYNYDVCSMGIAAVVTAVFAGIVGKEWFSRKITIFTVIIDGDEYVMVVGE